MQLFDKNFKKRYVVIKCHQLVDTGHCGGKVSFIRYRSHHGLKVQKYLV